MTDGDQEFLSAIKSVLKTLVKDAIRPGVSSAAETTWNKLRGMIDPAAHSVAGNILDETKLEEIHSAARLCCMNNHRVLITTITSN
jgi:hypothetical protein